MGDDNIHPLTREEGLVAEEFHSHYSRTKTILHWVKLHWNEASRVPVSGNGKQMNNINKMVFARGFLSLFPIPLTSNGHSDNGFKSVEF